MLCRRDFLAGAATAAITAASEAASSNNIRELLFAGPLPWTPLNLGTSGAAWFDSADPSTITLSGAGTVAGWNSKLGAGISVIQTLATSQPAYKLAQINNRNTVNWTNGTVYLVGGNVAVNIQNCAVLALINTPSTSVGVEVLGSDPNSQHRLDIAVNGTTGTLGYFVGNGNQNTGPNLFGATHIAGLYIATGVVTPRVDGTALATTTAPANSTTSIGIGSFAQSTTSTFNGDIGDVIYMAAPSLNQVQKAEGYIAWKWGIVASLPTAHPYKSRPPRITDPN